MELEWKIQDNDINEVKNIVASFSDNNFVKERIRRNVSSELPEFSKDEFWHRLVSCLLTTQQRSGPESQVAKIISEKPFSMSYEFCSLASNIKEEVSAILKNFGGIRRLNKIGEEVEYNYNWLERGGWDKIFEQYEILKANRQSEPSANHIKDEISACLLAQEMKGFGPKQSRNLWQSLGFTRYETPLDSRIVKWLNNIFPFKLTAQCLSDENYYQVVERGVQKLCNQAGILPCILDAAIFSSYDGDWPENVHF